MTFLIFVIFSNKGSVCICSVKANIYTFAMLKFREKEKKKSVYFWCLKVQIRTNISWTSSERAFFFPCEIYKNSELKFKGKKKTLFEHISHESTTWEKVLYLLIFLCDWHLVGVSTKCLFVCETFASWDQEM